MVLGLFALKPSMFTFDYYLESSTEDRQKAEQELEEKVLALDPDAIFMDTPLIHVLIQYKFPNRILNEVFKRVRNIDATQDGLSALHLSIEIGHPQALQLLLEHGANQLCYYTQRTPLVCLLDKYIYPPISFETDRYGDLLKLGFLCVMHGYPMDDPRLIPRVNQIYDVLGDKYSDRFLSLFVRFGFDLYDLDYYDPCTCNKPRNCPTCMVRILSGENQPRRLQAVCVRKIRSEIIRHKVDGRSIFHEIAKLPIPRLLHKLFLRN